MYYSCCILSLCPIKHIPGSKKSVMKDLAALFQRDLNKLKQEICLYTDPADMWRFNAGISNSGGNLCLHIIGNLKHFVGKTLGSIPYERVREKEFSDKDIPVELVLKMIDETADAVKTTLLRFEEADLQKTFPIKVFAEDMSTGQFLFHLYGHLNYHLGQINYHRRLINV
ncbi:MAG: DinB family protein [Chitinophagaceae bacterium]|nr:DinB family protein [Chitinophagaceae bacterium]